MTHLLDTDHLSILQHHNSSEYAVVVLNLSHHADTDICVSVVSLHEMAMGCNNLITNFRNPKEVLRGYDLYAKAIADFRRFTRRRSLSSTD